MNFCRSAPSALRLAAVGARLKVLCFETMAIVNVARDLLQNRFFWHPYHLLASLSSFAVLSIFLAFLPKTTNMSSRTSTETKPVLATMILVSDEDDGTELAATHQLLHAPHFRHEIWCLHPTHIPKNGSKDCEGNLWREVSSRNLTHESNKPS